MRKQYHPTPEDRCKVACAYDRSYITNVEETEHLTPADYDADGALVTLRDGGTTYWVVTLQEAAQVGIALDSVEQIKVGRRIWCVCLA